MTLSTDRYQILLYNICLSKSVGIPIYGYHWSWRPLAMPVVIGDAFYPPPEIVFCGIIIIITGNYIIYIIKKPIEIAMNFVLHHNLCYRILDGNHNVSVQKLFL